MSKRFFFWRPVLRVINNEGNRVCRNGEINETQVCYKNTNMRPKGVKKEQFITTSPPPAGKVPGILGTVRLSKTVWDLCRNSLFESRFVFIDLLARKLLELEEQVFRADAPVQLMRYRLAVFQRVVDHLPSVQHGRQFVAVRRGHGRRRSRRRQAVHRAQVTTE